MLFLHRVARLMRERLVLMRIEGLAGRVDFLETVRRERGLQLVHNHVDAADERLEGSAWLFGRLKGQGQIVHHGENVFQHAAGSGKAELILFPDRAAAKVLEIRSGAHEPVVVGCSLGFGGGNLGGEIGFRRGWRRDRAGSRSGFRSGGSRFGLGHATKKSRQ